MTVADATHLADEGKTVAVTHGTLEVQFLDCITDSRVSTALLNK